MKKIFNYHKFADENKNMLVDSFMSLVDAQMEGKGNTAEYKEANAQFNEAFMKECYSSMPNADMENFSLDEIKNHMVNTNLFFLNRFDTILAQMITPVVPKVVSGSFEQLYDVTVRLVSL